MKRSDGAAPLGVVGAEPHARPRPMTELRGDQRGAILITGLFMACFLIGCLWFIIGIGDTLVFRERMQEATDHAAFASAALHAKGMNFISLCNLVLLAAVAIHIILGIVHDIALAICIVSFGTTCGYWGTIREFYTTYFDVLKPAAKAIGVAEKVASYGFPVMGLFEGWQTGVKYSTPKNLVTVIPLSTSLVPGSLLGSKKEGLPVEQAPVSVVCHKIGSMGMSVIFGQALGASGKNPGGKVLDLAKDIIGDVVEARYCNDVSSEAGKSQQGSFVGRANDGNNAIDRNNRRKKKDRDKTPNVKIGDGSGDPNSSGGSGGGGGGSADPGFDSFWGEKIPMIPYSAASNGNEWFQTYAINILPKLPDESESKVGVARGPKNGMEKYTKTEKPLGYFAQSEFYFDCQKKWNDADCNFESNATFQIKWRARLRRVSLPNVTSMLAGMGFEVLYNVQDYEAFKQFSGQLTKLLGGGVLGRTVVKNLTTTFSRVAEAALREAVNDATKGNPFLVFGVYH